MKADNCSDCNKIAHLKDGLCARCRNLEELGEAYAKAETEAMIEAEAWAMIEAETEAREEAEARAYAEEEARDREIQSRISMEILEGCVKRR